jgi:hypothetical protein
MRPSAAEVARTVISGQVPATLRVACRPGPIPVRHATDCVGRPLVLARLDDPLLAVLRDHRQPPAVVLHASDVPPSPDAPGLGQVLVGGTLRPVPEEHLHPAVLEYAQTHADSDLFDVGTTAVLFQLDVQEVRLSPGPRAAPVTRAGPGGSVVDLDSYLAADPDPLYDQERDLLADLIEHHGDQLGPYLARCLADLDPPAGDGEASPLPVRLDRYGFIVSVPGTGESRRSWVRIPFRRAVRDRADLAHLLHPVLFPGHACGRADHTGD